MNALPLPVDLGDGLTPVDIWQSLHAGERSWIAHAGGRPKFLFSEQIDGSDRMLMERLQAFPADRWIALCNGVGWTGLGAAALSWCDGAKLADVLEVFDLLGLVPESGNVVERAASFIRPDLLPENRMSALADVSGGGRVKVLVLLAARQAPPVYDLDQPYERLAPEILSMIEARSQTVR